MLSLRNGRLSYVGDVRRVRLLRCRTGRSANSARRDNTGMRPDRNAQMAVRDVSARGDLRSRRETTKSAIVDLEVARLAARVEELERENVALETFAAVAAHELVEPLILTEAFAAMVSDRLDPDLHAESRSDLAMLRR